MFSQLIHCRPIRALGGAGSAYPSGRDRDDAYTVKVSNLSENAREDDLRVSCGSMRLRSSQTLLQDLFKVCGPVTRVHILTNKETSRSRVSY